MQIRTIILIISASVCFASCKTIRYVPAEKIVEIKTEMVEVIRDTTIYIPADQAAVTALLECDSAGQVLVKQVETLQGKLNAKASIRINDNIIVAECECDSLNIYLQLKDRYQTTTTAVVETKIQTVEKELTWWQCALVWVGGLCILSIITMAVLAIRKKLKQSFK